MVLAQRLEKQLASPWCGSRRKRIFDIVVATVALLVAAPLMLLIALAVRSTSSGPVVFRQRRCGLNARPFELLKFRTMCHVANTESGPRLTRSGDRRITPVGKWLRKWKLDELPQLINVLRGEMSIVGPRPDLEQFWREVTDVERRALAVKPGLTGAATLASTNEEELLARVPQAELLGFYLRDLLPHKARLDCQYAAQANFLSDCRVLLKTGILLFCASCRRNSGSDASKKIPTYSR